MRPTIPPRPLLTLTLLLITAPLRAAITDNFFVNVPAPTTYPIVALDNGQLTLTYQQLCDPTEISYSVEVPTDLVHWSSGPPNVQETVQGDGITVFCRDLTPIGSSPHFIRLRVTRLQ